MSGLDPTIDEVCERVWAGSRELHRSRGMRAMDLDDLRIVVSEEIWAKMLLASRDPKSKYHGAISYAYEGVINDEPIKYQARMFGTVTEVSKDLEPHEVRFRVEVPV